MYHSIEIEILIKDIKGSYIENYLNTYLEKHKSNIEPDKPKNVLELIHLGITRNKDVNTILAKWLKHHFIIGLLFNIVTLILPFIAVWLLYSFESLKLWFDSLLPFNFIYIAILFLIVMTANWFRIYASTLEKWKMFGFLHSKFPPKYKNSIYPILINKMND